MTARFFRRSLCLLILAALMLTACGTASPTESSEPTETTPTSIPPETEPPLILEETPEYSLSRCTGAMDYLRSAENVHYISESFRGSERTEFEEAWCRGEDYLTENGDSVLFLCYDSSAYYRTEGQSWASSDGWTYPYGLRFQPDGDYRFQSAQPHADGSLDITISRKINDQSETAVFRWDPEGNFLGYTRSYADEDGVYATSAFTVLAVNDPAVSDTIDEAFAQVDVAPIVTMANIDEELGNPDVTEVYLMVFDENAIPYEKINTFSGLRDLTINIEAGPNTLDMSLLTVEPENVVVETCISGEYMIYVNLDGVDDLQLYDAYVDFTAFPVSPDVRSFTIQFNTPDLTGISDALPNLENLRIVGRFAEADLSHTAGMEKLSWLYLGVSTDELLATLPELPSLTTVTIFERDITDISPLLAQPNLAVLELWYLEVPENEGLDGVTIESADDPAFDQLVTNIDKEQIQTLLEQGTVISLTPHHDPYA